VPTAVGVVVGRFKDKTAIVTGAGSGIGRAIVLRLVAEGASILGIDLNEVGLKETVQLTSNPERVSIAVVSVTDEQQVIEKVNEYVTRQGHLDVLINMAGILRVSHSADTSLEEFRSVIDINLTGTFLMCRTCLPHLLVTKGNIVNAASTAGRHGHPYMAAYAASKGAIVALTKSLAREYIFQGVRVNAVAPGGIFTPIMTSLQLPPGINEILFSNLKRPDSRFGKPEDVAGVVAMLASQDGVFINGEVIRIDGGTHA
jgi:NAD(P)-dependent dehydrogenase (short-subunit alcohol dehydrogenase family)